MINYYFLLFPLICPIFSGYQPLKKYYGFDKLNEKICKYKYSDIEYVKMCKDGQYCKQIDHELSMCFDVKKHINKKVLGDTCESTDECEPTLTCDNKCTYTCSNPSSETAFKTQSGSYDCKDNDMPAGLYYYATYDNNFVLNAPIKQNSIDYGKVGGIISYIKDNDNIYHITKRENAFIGTVKDGEFVGDELACESGYALLFYLDGSLKDPKKSTATTNNNMYKKCVTVNEVGYDQNGVCHVKYDDNKIYYSAPNCDEYLMTKLNLFKKYTEKFNKDKQESCAGNKENYNEPETCNDDEIRKWKYFYDTPEHYKLYYEKEDEVNDVVNYLIQDAYPEYQSNNFLKLKYLFLLLTLFLI
jgi:hypothetical protein